MFDIFKSLSVDYAIAMDLFTFELRFFYHFHVPFDIYKALSPFHALAMNLFAFELRVHRNSTKIC